VKTGAIRHFRYEVRQMARGILRPLVMTHSHAVRVNAPPALRAAPASALVVLATLVVCCLAPSAAAAQSCDPALARNDSRPISYRQRGDRCEGIYSKRVSAFGAQLISFTGQFDLRDLCSSGRPVHMVLPGHGAGAVAPVRLRGESLRPDLYYRVDVELGARGSFEWPFDPRCNNEVRLTAAELALTAKRTFPLGASQVEALVPVSLSFDPAVPAEPPYRALLMPGRRVKEVYVSLSRYEGTTRTRLFTERALKRRPYAPDTPIPVVLERADVTAAGLHRAVITVEFESGEAETIDFYFINGR
jgi:hypothetical protein